MKQTFSVLLGALALALPALAAAQTPPQTATVPWVGNSPNVPHDIISGVVTRVKGVEVGRDPPAAGNGSLGALDSITLEVLDTCSAYAPDWYGADLEEFYLNGVHLGNAGSSFECTCGDVPRTVTITNPALLAAWQAGGAANVARVVNFGQYYFVWAAMTVTSGGQTRRACIYDQFGRNCGEAEVCDSNGEALSFIDRSTSNFVAGAPGLVYSGATYSWDFGDGSAPTAPAAVTAVNRRNLAVSHTYNGAVGSPFNARLTICDAANTCSTATYRMVIRANTQEARTNIATDEGLWYLHTKQLSSGKIQADGSFGERLSATAAAVNAFEAHGHVQTQNRLVNPYAETVANGLKFVFKGLTTGATSVQPAGNPDSNGNGLYQSAESPAIYTTGIVMDAIITTGTPNAVVADGPAAGRTYAQAVQDMVDAYALGQMDNQDARRRGSWHYEFSHGNNAAQGHADNSSSGWAGIGMIPAERNWGLTVPAFVKTENLIAMQSTYASAGGECATIGYGAIAEFGGNGCIWGCAATTPNGMVQLVMSSTSMTIARSWPTPDSRTTRATAPGTSAIRMMTTMACWMRPTIAAGSPTPARTTWTATPRATPAIRTTTTTGSSTPTTTARPLPIPTSSTWRAMA